jgi:hypothetical protein
MRSTLAATFLSLVLAATTGCAKNIPNTTLEDNAENREIVGFLEEYRHAVESRDVAGILRLVSPLYLDDNGTPRGEDDVDYATLQTKLRRLNERVLDVRYEIKYRHVTYDPTRIFVELRYTSSFQIVGASGQPIWSRRVGDNRIVLVREEGNLRIVSGI